mmetsp:Transcript_39802/g.29366  ORF Transcript_39802/g.29366 Transcript_39802/m.29366 type:complete len:156 (+) Transcript_39802:667-1134(+)
MSKSLQFDVYHQHLSSTGRTTTTPIGSAFVDLSLLAYTSSGQYEIAGHFHVMKQGTYSSVEDLAKTKHQVLSKDSQGQLKIRVQTSANLESMKGEVLRESRRKHSPMKESGRWVEPSFNPFSREEPLEQSFANDKLFIMGDSFSQSQFHMMSETH